MEENKIVKVYSNNSKKARIKRNKNKFQRIWDAEKQTYIKVRKAKYPSMPKKSKKDWREKVNDEALKRRQTTPKQPKTAVVKPEKKQPARVNTKQKATTKMYKIHGINYAWDNKTLHYKVAA